MPARQELAITPGGSRAADLLKEAYMRACHPTPFDPERGNPDMAKQVYERIARVPFSPFWTDRFQDYRDNYNGNPAGMLAQNIFRAAEKVDGVELQVTVAAELASSFADDILEAEIDVPALASMQGGTAIAKHELSPLAQFLLDRREQFEGNDPAINEIYADEEDDGGEDTVVFMHKGFSIPERETPPQHVFIDLTGSGQKISSSWIAFAHVLASTNPAQHDLLFEEMKQAYNETDKWTRVEMAYTAGMMGGFGIFDRHYSIKKAVAGVLAHFPDLLISRLRDAGSATESVPQLEPSLGEPQRLPLE